MKSLSTNNLHDWAKDLLVVAVHARANVVHNCRSNPVALGIARHLDATAVQQEVSIISTILNQALNLGEVLRVVERGDISVIDTSTNGEALSTLDDLGDPLC